MVKLPKLEDNTKIDRIQQLALEHGGDLINSLYVTSIDSKKKKASHRTGCPGSKKNHNIHKDAPDLCKQAVYLQSPRERW